MSDFPPFRAEMRDMELATTQSRIKARRRKHRHATTSARSAGSFGSLKLASLRDGIRADGVRFPEKPRVAGLFKDVLRRNGGIYEQ